MYQAVKNLYWLLVAGNMKMLQERKKIFYDNTAAIIAATRSPSMAALTIPPA